MTSARRDRRTAVKAARKQEKKDRRKAKLPKKFLLDTNVLIQDPDFFRKFGNQDIVLIPEVLEELDKFKRGKDDRAASVRLVGRNLKKILRGVSPAMLALGVSLATASEGAATGNLHLYNERIAIPEGFTFSDASKVDNRILAAVQQVQAKYPTHEVVLVSNDINLYTKGMMLGIPVEEYENEKVIEDADYLRTGVHQLPRDFWNKIDGKKLKTEKDGHDTVYSFPYPLSKNWHLNDFVFLEEPGVKPFHARVMKKDGDVVTLRTITDYTKKSVYNLKAKNREQNFLLNLLMDPEIDLITVAGPAGTGKTIAAVAAGMEQTHQLKGETRFKKVVYTRAMIAIGTDPGALPGTKEEKFGPYGAPLKDALEALGYGQASKGDDRGEYGEENDEAYGFMKDLKRYVGIELIAYIRGRSLYQRFIIIDEAQNLTKHEVATIVSRAGPGTKVILLGNLAQIDAPYVTEGSCGLVHAATGFAGWERAAHITMVECERSALARKAAEVL